MMMYIVMIGVLSIPSVNFGICKDAAVLINIFVLMSKSEENDDYKFALMLNIVDFDDCECCLDPTHVWRLNVAAPSVNFFTW